MGFNDHFTSSEEEEARAGGSDEEGAVLVVGSEDDEEVEEEKVRSPVKPTSRPTIAGGRGRGRGQEQKATPIKASQFASPGPKTRELLALNLMKHAEDARAMEQAKAAAGEKRGRPSQAALASAVRGEDGQAAAKKPRAAKPGRPANARKANPGKTRFARCRRFWPFQRADRLPLLRMQMSTPRSLPPSPKRTT